ncbi:MAG: Ig-like domain-containing protein, partial [Lachnospiraceae bacterium]|nr:Ig-like domain-containing protein [Lachnospiraceae bacterium]
TITLPDGSTDTWSDDDMDGIIYKKGIASGNYKVEVNALTDDKYQNYILPVARESVTVKEEIDYKKVDVKNEIKTESQVNASKEDTKKNQTVVESTLQDTVQWVESSVTANTYVEVAKSTIPEPTTLVAKGSFLRTATYTASISTSSKAMKKGETFTLTAQCQGVNLNQVNWVSSNPSVATITGSGATVTVTAVGTGQASISFTANGTAVSGSDAVNNLTGTCMVTVTEANAPISNVTIEPASQTVTVGAQTTAKVQIANLAETGELAYAVLSNNDGIATATVDNAGNITIKGVAVGDAAITVWVNHKNGDPNAAISATMHVKVVANNLSITLDKTAATVFLSNPITIHATIGNATTQTAVTAETSDANVATVAVNDKTVTITGVNTGSATVTVKYVENGSEVKATCAVTVKAHPKDDTTTLLKDAQGQQLYVMDGESYREAVYADYYSASQFFVKGTAKYTGWQTLDGKVYFFDGAGQKVTGEQVIQGAKYNFASDGSLVTGSGTMGIDVSKWNGKIDWNAVKNSGVSYVIIRCGYRGSSQGALIEDPKYWDNIKGATKAGLKVGVYFFTQAVDEVEAVEEASMVLDMVSGYKISYPIFLDVEPSGGRADKIDKATRTAVCKAFCKTIQDAGYTAGIYANKTWLTSKIDTSQLSGYKIWLAQYAATPTYTGIYDLWQYKSTGRVSGISGDVDMNISYLGY